MTAVTESLTIRLAQADDIESMRTLLNEIIRVGGTTAITNELSPDEMREWFVSGDNVVSCFVAIDSDGAIVGFQSLRKYDTLPDGCVDIATFTSQSRHKSGVGSALFTRTREAAVGRGFSAINASIRVDNVSGLAYYGRMGFETCLIEDGDPQAQGRAYNRVHKRFLCLETSNAQRRDHLRLQPALVDAAEACVLNCAPEVSRFADRARRAPDRR